MLIYPVSGNSNNLEDIIIKIGCSEKSKNIFPKKFDTLPIKINGIKAPMANIIKQEMISCKGDAVVHSLTIACAIKTTDILLLGNLSIYENFIEKMKIQDSHTLTELAKNLKEVLAAIINKNGIQKTRNNKILNYTRPVIMGILNITDDSFYDGGKFSNYEKALKHCEEMIHAGADIIDIGGESSRPGAEPVSVQVELDRIIPIVKEISKNFKAIISVDSCKSKVAEEALKAGADIINDISSFRFDPDMAGVVKKYGALAVLMHMKGTPKNMQENPEYSDVISELIEFFDERISFIKNYGIDVNSMIIDPGIGFGKSLNHNKEILRHLSSFKKYGLPVMIGASRKSSIGMILNDTDIPKEASSPSERLYGTLGANAFAFFMGADIFRVNDVKENYELLKVMNSIK